MILSRKTTRTAAKCADTSTENSGIDIRKLRLEKVTQVLHIKSAKFTAEFNNVFNLFPTVPLSMLLPTTAVRHFQVYLLCRLVWLWLVHSDHEPTLHALGHRSNWRCIGILGFRWCRDGGGSWNENGSSSAGGSRNWGIGLGVDNGKDREEKDNKLAGKHHHF